MTEHDTCDDANCPRHGVIASLARQNRYWQEIGGHPGPEVIEE